jgi:hypothetical protein
MSASPEPRTSLRRIESPTIDQFAQAAEVCYTRWDYMRELDSPARFEAFQKLNVELCVLVDGGGAMQSVGYLVPSRLQIGGETLCWHYMFQVASRPETAGAGALLIRQAMKWYPAIFGMGITPDAERLYKAFRWQQYEGFWRGVHPLNLSRLLKDYGDRIPQLWLRRLLRASAGIGSFVGSQAEVMLSLGSRSTSWAPPNGKGAIIGRYLDLFTTGDVQAADVGGAGRVLSLPAAGSLRQHAAIWRALRRQNARFCEMLLFSEAARKRAWHLGYVPVPLQVWCWDPGGILGRAIPVLREKGFSFFDTDKVL